MSLLISPDVVLCGGLGSKHPLINQLSLLKKTKITDETTQNLTVHEGRNKLKECRRVIMQISMWHKVIVYSRLFMHHFFVQHKAKIPERGAI